MTRQSELIQVTGVPPCGFTVIGWSFCHSNKKDSWMNMNLFKLGSDSIML